MKLSVNWLIMITVFLTLGLAGACGGDSESGCNPDEEPEEVCQCDNDAGFRVCDAETEEWGECICAARSVRFCNLFFPKDDDGELFSISCTVTLVGESETVSYTALNGECDQPVGNFCRPLPSDEVLVNSLECVDAADGTSFTVDGVDFPILGQIPLPGSEDYAIVLDYPENIGLGLSPITFPTEGVPGLSNEDTTYETCEDFTIPTFDEIKAL